jgi:hypothetical protein
LLLLLCCPFFFAGMDWLVCKLISTWHFNKMEELNDKILDADVENPLWKSKRDIHDSRWKT